MNDEAALRDKLRKIEALFVGVATAGEKAAAGAAADRIRARLREEEKREKPVEMRFSLPDPGRGRCSSRCAGAMACGRIAIPACAGKASWFGYRRLSSTKYSGQSSRRSTLRSPSIWPR